MRIVLLIVALLWMPLVSQAGDVAAIEVEVNGCKWVKICENEAGTGRCHRGADDISAIYQRGYSHTLYADQSTSASFTARLCGSSTLATTNCGLTSPAITVTNAVEVQPFDAVFFTYWIDITANPADNVTVWDYICPLGIGS